MSHSDHKMCGRLIFAKKIGDIAPGDLWATSMLLITLELMRGTPGLVYRPRHFPPSQTTGHIFFCILD